MKFYKNFWTFLFSTVLCMAIGLVTIGNSMGSDFPETLDESDINNAIDKAEPLIAEITGFKFKEKLKYRLLSRSDFAKEMASDFLPYLTAMMKGADDETVMRQAEFNAQQRGQTALGGYCIAKKELLMIPDNLSPLAELYEIKSEEFEDFLFLYVAYNMVNLLDDQYFPEDEKKESDQEKAKANFAMRNGYAVYVVKKLADNLKMPQAVQDKALKSYARITDETNAIQQQNFNLMYIKSSELIKTVVDERGPSAINDLLLSSSISMRHIMNPNEYLSPTGIKEIDCEKLVEVISKKLPTKGMQSQSVKLGPATLGNILIAQGASRQDSNSIAAECLNGAVYTAVKPGQQTCMVVATVMQFSTKEALSNYMVLNQKIVESTRNQINAMPNATINVIKEQELEIDGYENTKYQHIETKVDNQVTGAFSTDGLTDTFYMNILYVNPEKDQNEETLSDFLKFMNKERLKLM